MLTIDVAGSMQAQSSRQKKELILICTFSFELSAKIMSISTPY